MGNKKPVKKDDEKVDVSDVGLEFKEHMSLEQIMFAEHFAVTSDKIGSIKASGLTSSGMTKSQAEISANILMNDKYVKGYIDALRRFALNDGLEHKYQGAVAFLESVMNGTVRDANQNLEIPKVTARVAAAKELVRLLPESMDFQKLEADTELQKANVELQKEKLKVIQTGGMGASENVMLNALKELNDMGLDTVE